jgi:hypothetical protein
MIDYFNLPNNDKNVQIFYGIGSSVWQIWQKPNGCKFAEMFVMGGGAGGSSGQTAASGTRLGGGGGGGAATSKGVFSINTIPDTLYILVGMGGNGQTSSANGTSGGLSYVSITPSIASNADFILVNGAVGPTCSNGSPAGSAGTIFVQTAAFCSYLGLVTPIAGSIGFGGGDNASPGTSISVTNITTGGAGGGSIRSLGSQEFAAGGLTGSGFIPTIAGSAGLGGEGISAPFYNLPSINNMNYPMIFIGGLGGGSSNSANGGKGGNGSYGCGGGGGGGGTTLGGFGGNGGDGLVIITSW